MNKQISAELTKLRIVHQYNDKIRPNVRISMGILRNSHT